METTRGLAQAAQVWVGGNLLTVCDGISTPGRRCPPGPLSDVKLAYVTAEGLSWPEALRGNPSRRKVLEPLHGWSYVGYGQIVSVLPVVIDFGLVRMESPQWTTDDGYVGRYVRVPIDRLELVPAHKEDAPPAGPVAAGRGGLEVMTTTAYIALGSNVGDRAETLISAMRMLAAAPGVRVRKISQFIKTQPEGGPDGQGEYLNAAAEIETSLTPQQLLEQLAAIERQLGRRREQEERWGPRTCDLDILLMGELVLTTEVLTVPHPRMHQRRFVLEPLASIAPQAVHPVLRKTAAQLLAELRR